MNMKKYIFLLCLTLTFFFCEAQKFAYVDTDYILNKIPDYSQAQDKLDEISIEFQKDIDGAMNRVQTATHSHAHNP